MSKKLQVLADPTLVNFFEMHLIQHLESLHLIQHLESFDLKNIYDWNTWKFGNLLVQGQELPGSYNIGHFNTKTAHFEGWFIMMY